MSEDQRHFLEDIKAAMLRRGVSQRDVARSCAISQAQISRVLSGKSKLSRNVERRLRQWMSTPNLPHATEARVVELLTLVAELRPEAVMHLMHLLEELIVVGRHGGKDGAQAEEPGAGD